jgi:hypothetical protein
MATCSLNELVRVALAAAQLLQKLHNGLTLCVTWHQSINQCYICSNELHREFMPAIHRKSLVWLILTWHVHVAGLAKDRRKDY